MIMSMRSIKSEFEGSLFPLKLGVAPMPSWKRRVTVSATTAGDRTRRSEQAEVETTRKLELVHTVSDKTDC